MAANSENMDSQSILDTGTFSDDVSNVTLSSLLAAIQDINKTVERKFSEMENSLGKKLTDSMLKVCDAKIGQAKQEIRSESNKLTDRIVTVENRDSTNCNGHIDPCKLNFIVRK